MIYSKRDPITVIGALRYADALKKSEVKLVDEAGATWTVDVPEGSMEDVLRAHFGNTVKVSGSGSHAKQHIRLDEIDEREFA